MYIERVSYTLSAHIPVSPVASLYAASCHVVDTVRGDGSILREQLGTLSVSMQPGIVQWGQPAQRERVLNTPSYD